MLFYNCKITKIGQCLTHMNSLQQYAIFLTLSCTHTHLHAGSHHTWCWSRKENAEITSLLLKGAFCKQCILVQLIEERKIFHSKCCFFSLPFKCGVQGAQSLPKPEWLEQAEEAVLTAWVYSWKKAHNVSSVRWLTLETSQLRTKLSQSSCPPWVSGLSSGFIKLLRKETHQGRLSRKVVGAWPGAHQQLLRKSALFAVCVSACVRIEEQL